MINERLKARLRALLAKTVENGCTEAEAMSAAAKAAALMEEFSLSAADLAMITATMPRGTKRATLRERLYSAISNVTNSAGLYHFDAETGESIVTFYGLEPGPTIAAYLRDLCDRAIDREIKLFKDTAIYKSRRKTATRRSAVADFTIDIVSRVVIRLHQLFRRTMDDQKVLAAQAARDKADPDSKAVVVPTKKPRFTQATGAGWKAGENVDLHHGVSAGTAPLAIGRG